MEILLAVTIGALVGVGTFLLLMRSMLRVILGIFVTSYATNLLLLVMGGLKTDAVPVIQPEIVQTFADPLVQAFILTAIIINLGMIIFLLVLVSRTQQEFGSDDLDRLRDLRG